MLYSLSDISSADELTIARASSILALDFFAILSCWMDQCALRAAFSYVLRSLGVIFRKAGKVSFAYIVPSDIV